MAVVSTIQFKRGTKENLERLLIGDRKPLAGEPIFETDTYKIKIGNGINDYKDLPYLSGGSGSDSSVVYAATVYDFPKVGVGDKLYVAMDENNTYFWNNGYKLAGVDSREIDAGGADADVSYNRGKTN